MKTYTTADEPARTVDFGRPGIWIFLSLLSLVFLWALGFARSRRQTVQARERKRNPRDNRPIEIQPAPGTLDPPPARSKPSREGTKPTGGIKIQRPRKDKPGAQNRSLEIQPAPGTTEPPPPEQ